MWSLIIHKTVYHGCSMSMELSFLELGIEKKRKILFIFLMLFEIFICFYFKFLVHYALYPYLLNCFHWNRSDYAIAISPYPIQIRPISGS